jgi:two-component system sensor histidine kinase/response regulator
VIKVQSGWDQCASRDEDGNADDARIAELTARVTELEQQNRTLSEALHQANRLRRIWWESISELKSTKRDLSASRDFLLLMLNEAPLPIILVSRYGHLRFMNHAAEEMFGPLEAIPRRQARNLLEYFERPEAVPRMRELLGVDGRGERAGEFRVHTRDDRIRLLEVYWTYAEGAGHGDGVILMGRDITTDFEVKQELRRAKDEAETGARLKAQFLANMSHEIRTPMNAIIGMTDLLLDTRLDQTQSEYVTIVRTSGDALLSLINDILDFSKIESGKLELEQIPFNLRVCVEEVGDLLGPKAYDKGLELAILIHSELPEQIVGDPVRLRQILLNLVNNAIKFTKTGEIGVRVRLDAEAGNRVKLRFEVQDTGPGIPKSRMDRLFKSFSQVDASNTREHGGSGLGLAISRQLSELMGGSIGVKSKLGEGSTFWFTVEAQRAEPAEPAPIDRDIRGTRVLVVDDNNANRRLIRDHLALAGCTVVEVKDGYAALSLLGDPQSAGSFQVAILDYQMPGMDGQELAVRLRAETDYKQLPLILLTSSPRRGDLERMRESGFWGYLTKPIKRDHLFGALSAVLSRREHLGPEATDRPQMITRYTLNEARRTTLRILVVEDNMVNQRVAVRMLEKLGYRCDLAADGREAVDACERVHYDLVLMDCQMPVMDGFDASREIRRREQARGLSPTRIVALTAAAYKSDQDQCLAAGMDDFMAKPFKLDELRDVISHQIVIGSGGRDPG